MWGEDIFFRCSEEAIAACDAMRARKQRLEKRIIFAHWRKSSSSQSSAALGDSCLNIRSIFHNPSIQALLAADQSTKRERNNSTSECIDTQVRKISESKSDEFIEAAMRPHFYSTLSVRKSFSYSGIRPFFDAWRQETAVRSAHTPGKMDVLSGIRPFFDAWRQETAVRGAHTSGKMDVLSRRRRIRMLTYCFGCMMLSPSTWSTLNDQFSAIQERRRQKREEKRVLGGESTKGGGSTFPYSVATTGSGTPTSSFASLGSYSSSRPATGVLPPTTTGADLPPRPRGRLLW